MSNVIIFLDFDGVLCDSVKEAYLLSRYAFKSISPFDEIDEKEYKQFRKYRPNITNSWQYYNFYVDKNEPYNSITEKFNEKFLLMRKELMTNHYDFWQALEEKTSFVDKIRDLINTNIDSFRILSTKNKEAIIKKLQSWQINVPFEYIYDKKDLLNISKGNFIKKLKVEKAILIDDSEENILSCENIQNIKAILTNWGYVKNPQNGKSEEEILKIIKEYLLLQENYL